MALRWKRRRKRLIARHASLRAGFRHEELSRPVQIIVPQAAAPWRMIDLSSLDEAIERRRRPVSRRRIAPRASISPRRR